MYHCQDQWIRSALSSRCVADLALNKVRKPGSEIQPPSSIVGSISRCSSRVTAISVDCRILIMSLLHDLLRHATVLSEIVGYACAVLLLFAEITQQPIIC